MEPTTTTVSGFQLKEVARKNGNPVKHYVVLSHEQLVKIKDGFKKRYGVTLETPTQLADVLIRAAEGNIRISEVK